MNKDVIYIDTEDDITAIIGKIKAGKERVVALVPPKRTGILQSAVNLRLLSRMAETSNKKLVIVTTNKALIALSSVAMIPIAKNLQSKPELAEVDAIEDDGSEDIIDGAQLPIGELAKTSDIPVEETTEDAIETINIEEFESPKSKADKPKIKNNGVKIPDFKSFRKKLFLGIGFAIIATVFLVWAIKFAPAARVIVTTTTTPAPVSATVKLGGSEATNVSKNIIQTVTKQTKKDLSVEFTATGTKDNGAKASGTVTLSYAGMIGPEVTATLTSQQISFGDKTFNMPSNKVTFTKGSGETTGYATVDISAEQNGDSYNVAAGSCTVVGASELGCSSSSAMTGGTTNIVSIVTAADIQKASQVLVDMPSTTVLAQLTKQFTNGEKVIAESFTIDRAAAVSVPAVGGEVSGTTKPKLTSATTYSLTAIAKSELQTFLKDSITKQITNTKLQRIYNDGVDSAVLSGYVKSDALATINISTTGKIGPSIDEAYIMARVKGKRFGDIQSTLNAVSGVEDVEVKFSYFWVSTVPTDESKITIEFVSADAGSK